MSQINLETPVKAPVVVCFDLSRSIDLHAKSMAHTSEKAVAGRTAGLIERGETVTWEAIHFGLHWRLSSKITEMKRPEYFVDEMVKGPFACTWHRHEFKPDGKSTLMIDTFEYQLPLGIFGMLADLILVRRYLRKLLLRRNEYIKMKAESGET